VQIENVKRRCQLSIERIATECYFLADIQHSCDVFLSLLHSPVHERNDRSTQQLNLLPLRLEEKLGNVCRSRFTKSLAEA
jgi:hypothetical protein